MQIKIKNVLGVSGLLSELRCHKFIRHQKKLYPNLLLINRIFLNYVARMGN